MGVSIKEILEDKFFKKYEIMAGEKGINNEVQAVALFDAPDGYLWFKGKEFVLSTGYLFKDKEDYFLDVIDFLSKQKTAGLGIKKDRYLNEIPESVIKKCNELNFPIINVPYNVAWVDLINAINSIAVNRFVMRIIDNTEVQSIKSSQNIKMKIIGIISKLSEEIKKPIIILEPLTGEELRFPDNFIQPDWVCNFIDLENHPFDYRKELLCDKLRIARISPMLDNSFSYITLSVPIREDKTLKMTICEKDEKLDYYDILAVRIAAVLLTEVYQQAYIFHSYEGRYADEFIKALIAGDLNTYDKVLEALGSSNSRRIKLDSIYKIGCLKVMNDHVDFYKKREVLHDVLRRNLGMQSIIFGIVSPNEVVILVDAQNNKITSQLQSKLIDVSNDLEQELKANINIGIGTEVSEITQVKKSYFESVKAIEVGRLLFDKRKAIDFKDLGPFGLLRLENIQRKDFGSNFDKINPILQEENSQELLETLRVFLESESHYNIAAKKLFLHTNTIRYRLAKIQQICDIDLDDPVERLKIEVTLKFLELVK